MANWKVVYQNTPFNFSAPRSLVIEADTREAAVVTAYDHLTRQGHAVGGFAVDFRPPIDLQAAHLLGYPEGFMTGDTRFRSVTEYAVTVTGKVVSLG